MSNHLRGNQTLIRISLLQHRCLIETTQEGENNGHLSRRSERADNRSLGLARGSRWHRTRCASSATQLKPAYSIPLRAEAQSRSAFVSSLNVDVINPLLSLKVCDASSRPAATRRLRFIAGDAGKNQETHTGRHQGIDHCPPRLPRECPATPKANVHKEMPGSRGAPHHLLIRILSE